MKTNIFLLERAEESGWKSSEKNSIVELRVKIFKCLGFRCRKDLDERKRKIFIEQNVAEGQIDQSFVENIRRQAEKRRRNLFSSQLVDKEERRVFSCVSKQNLPKSRRKKLNSQKSTKDFVLREYLQNRQKVRATKLSNSSNRNREKNLHRSAAGSNRRFHRNFERFQNVRSTKSTNKTFQWQTLTEDFHWMIDRPFSSTRFLSDYFDIFLSEKRKQKYRRFFVSSTIFFSTHRNQDFAEKLNFNQRTFIEFRAKRRSFIGSSWLDFLDESWSIRSFWFNLAQKVEMRKSSLRSEFGSFEEKNFLRLIDESTRESVRVCWTS